MMETKGGKEEEGEEEEEEEEGEEEEEEAEGHQDRQTHIDRERKTGRQTDREKGRKKERKKKKTNSMKTTTMNKICFVCTVAYRSITSFEIVNPGISGNFFPQQNSSSATVSDTPLVHQTISSISYLHSQTARIKTVVGLLHVVAQTHFSLRSTVPKQCVRDPSLPT